MYLIIAAMIVCGLMLVLHVAGMFGAFGEMSPNDTPFPQIEAVALIAVLVLFITGLCTGIR